MPITAKAQGKTFTFADGTTSEQMGVAIDEFFSKQQPQSTNVAEPQQDPGLLSKAGQFAKNAISDAGETLAGGLETAATLATGAVAEPISGLAGLASAPFVGAERAADIVKGTQDSLTYKPQTGRGQQFTQGIGEALAPVGDAISGTENALGDTVLDATGSPFLAAAAHSIPTALMSAGGGGALKKSTQAGGAPDAPQINPEQLSGGPQRGLFGGERRLSRRQQDILQELQTNPENPDLAKYLVVEGRPQASRQLRQAATAFGGRAGKEFVAVAKNGSVADRAATRRMLAIIREGRVNPRFRDANRVGDVVGEALTDRVRAANRIRSSAGASLDNIARNQLQNLTVDISQARQTFDQALTDLRVAIGDDGGLDFTQSAFRGGNAGAARNLISDIHQSMTDNSMRGHDAHFLKKLIDNQVTFGKADGGLSGDLDRAVKGLRGGINDSIRAVHTRYGQVNDRYSGAVNALDSIQSAGGSKLDLDNASALGTTLKRLTSNATSRAPLASSLDQLEGFLRENGVRYNNSISHQNHIANALEKRFKLAPENSLQGQQAQAIARESRRGPTDVAVDLAAKGVDLALQKTDRQAIEALTRAIR